MCNYKHWMKGEMVSGHIIRVHGRKGSEDDIITNVEEDAQKIRDIQTRVFRGEPAPEKISPARESR